MGDARRLFVGLAMVAAPFACKGQRTQIFGDRDSQPAVTEDVADVSLGEERLEATASPTDIAETTSESPPDVASGQDQDDNSDFAGLIPDASVIDLNEIMDSGTTDSNLDGAATDAPPIDVTEPTPLPTTCLPLSAFPELGSPCTLLGKISCSNLEALEDSQWQYGPGAAPNCVRPVCLRCEAVPGTGESSWVAHWCRDLASPSGCKSTVNNWTCVPSSGGPPEVIGMYDCVVGGSGTACAKGSIGTQVCHGSIGIDTCKMQGPDAISGTNACNPACVGMPRWQGTVCFPSLACSISKPGQYFDYFPPKCIQDTPKTVHCAKTCEEMGMKTPPQ